MRGLFEGAVYSEGANYSRKYGVYIYIYHTVDVVSRKRVRLVGVGGIYGCG